MTVSYWGVDHGTGAEDVEKALGMPRFAGAAKTLARGVSGGLKQGRQAGGFGAAASGAFKGAKGALKPAGNLARGGMKEMRAGVTGGARQAGGAVKQQGSNARRGWQGFAQNHPVAAGGIQGGLAGGAATAAIAGPFAAYNHSQRGQRQTFGKSKEYRQNAHYKAAVWNRDLVGNTPQAKQNRKITQRESLKGQAKGLAAGAALGVGAVATHGGVKGLRAGARFNKLSPGTFGAGSRARLAGGAAKDRVKSIHGVIGGLGGASVGQIAGDYHGRVKAQQHPDYRRRTN